MRVLTVLALGAVLFTPGVRAEDGGSAMAIEAFEPVDAGVTVESFEAADAGPSVESFVTGPAAATVRVYGNVRGETSIDSLFDSPRNVPFAENVAEGHFRAMAGLDARLSPNVRVVVEGRAQLRLVTQRDFDRARGFFEPMLGDAFVDLYTPSVDLRVGNQRITLGANALAPADALNPRDLRESLINGDPDDSVLPVFAIRAQGELGKVAWLAAYAPFFSPNRFFLSGQDEALLQPALGPAFDDRRVDPSVADLGQDRILETKRPVPFAGDFALRLVSTGKLKLGASWVWVNEKMPRVVMDAELGSILASQVAGKQPSSAATVSVLNRFQAGETLFTGSYKRSHLFSLEGSTLLGPGQLDADLSYSPRQTFFDAKLTPIDKAVITWVVGYSQASDSPWVYSINYLGLAVPDMLSQEQLILIEPATAVGGARTAFLHLFLGAVSYRFWKDCFEVSLRAAFEPIQKSFALGPRVTFIGVEGLKVWLAGEVFDGPAFSPFGYFGRNDKIVLGARWDAL